MWPFLSQEKENCFSYLKGYHIIVLDQDPTPVHVLLLVHAGVGVGSAKTSISI